MDSMQAFARGEAARSAGNKMMVFDWLKAATLIKERQPKVASAGLKDDWEWTGGEIYKDSKPVSKDDTYTYLASTWAVPELSLDGDIIECWEFEDELPGWGEGTYWPSEALAILSP